MFAALDLHERSVQCVLKDDVGRIVRESKLARDPDQILQFLADAMLKNKIHAELATR